MKYTLFMPHKILCKIALLIVFLAPILRADTPPQLLLKEGFEKTDSVAEWRKQALTELSRDAAPFQSHSGQAALRYEITSANNTEHYIYRGVKLPGKLEAGNYAVRIRFYARTSGNIKSPAFAFRVLERGENTPIGWLAKKTNAVQIQPSKQWIEHHAEETLDTQTRGFTIYIVALNPQPDEIIWMDDLSLELVPVNISGDSER